MLEATISGLIIAAAGGLTFLAYKHPAAFELIYKPITLALFLIFTALAAWHIAIMVAYTRLIPVLGVEKLDAAEAVLDEISLPIGWIILGYLAVSFYLSFLHALPKIIERGGNDADSE